MTSHRCLLVFRSNAPERRPSLAVALEKAGFAVDCLAVPYDAPRRGMPAIFGHKPSAASYDLVVVSEYLLAFGLCLRLMFARRPRLAAVAFNQSTRLVRTGIGPVDWLLNRIWRRLDAVLVHSEDEARMFAEVHAIPRDRFVFSHWGYDLPAFDVQAVAIPAEPYVTMIGRNNRDLTSFVGAVERAGVKGVLITSEYMTAELKGSVPDSVQLLVDRSMEECLAYVAGSFAHLVLVKDASRGAGHISAVSAMLLAKPQIFSDVAPIAEYLADDVNGLAVPPADPEAAAAAIVRLRDDPALAARLGESGRAFALAWLGDAMATQRIADFCVAAADRKPLPRFTDWRSLLSRRR